MDLEDLPDQEQGQAQDHIQDQDHILIHGPSKRFFEGKKQQ